MSNEEVVKFLENVRTGFHYVNDFEFPNSTDDILKSIDSLLEYHDLVESFEKVISYLKAGLDNDC